MFDSERWQRQNAPFALSLFEGTPRQAKLRSNPAARLVEANPTCGRNGAQYGGARA